MLGPFLGTVRRAPHNSVHHRLAPPITSASLNILLFPRPATQIRAVSSPALLKSTLVVNGDLSRFPCGSYSNFSRVRQTSGIPYFDRTGYIPALDKVIVIMFLRPWRFGKSLTLSMLEHFYGVQHKSSYAILFKDLEVDKHVIANKVKPSKYLVLNFDFSSVVRSPDLNKAALNLVDMINSSVVEFCREYQVLLGKPTKEYLNMENPIFTLSMCISSVIDILRKVKASGDEAHPLAGVKGIYVMADEYDTFSNEYMDPHGLSLWEGSEPAALLKGFWAVVKRYTGYNFGVEKCFITGISPLSLVDNTSGFNIATNVSFQRDFSGLCGLTRADIVDSLKRICNKDETQVHVKKLTELANGYHFCAGTKMEVVYNTDTCLQYFQNVLKNEPITESPPNSEVSEMYLKLCAGSPAAINDMQTAISLEADGSFKRIPYSQLVDRFGISDLKSNIQGLGYESAWRTLMLYFGGFTFDPEHPTWYLKITNKITARRFGAAILDRFSLLGSITTAVRFLGVRGEIGPVLAAYQRLMVARDVGFGDYKKTEEMHRDSMYISILTNPALASFIEYNVMKPSATLGRVDLIVQSSKHFILTEWKSIDADYLDIRGSRTQKQKLQALADLDVDEILKLRFNTRERFRTGTVRKWIEKAVAKQMVGYVQSLEVKVACGERVFHAHLVLVIGSRQALVWDMDKEGRWIGEPVLVGG